MPRMSRAAAGDKVATGSFGCRDWKFSRYGLVRQGTEHSTCGFRDAGLPIFRDFGESGMRLLKLPCVRSIRTAKCALSSYTTYH